MTTRSEFIIEELIGWAVRGAEVPGKIKEWYEVLRLVRVAQATEQEPQGAPAICAPAGTFDGLQPDGTTLREPPCGCAAALMTTFGHARSCPSNPHYDVTPVYDERQTEIVEGIQRKDLGRE